jgi:hypothetical protein
VPTFVAPALMRSLKDKMALARSVLEAADSIAGKEGNA